MMIVDNEILMKRKQTPKFNININKIKIKMKEN